MVKKNLYFGIFFAAFAAACMPVALKLGVGMDPTGIPLEGFMPFVMCLCILACGVILILNSLRAMNGKLPEEKIPQEPADIAAMEEEDRKRNLPRLLYTIIGMIAILVIWKFVNFYLAIALFCIIINKVVFKMTWVYTAIFTAVLLAALYFGFGMGFKVRFSAV